MRPKVALFPRLRESPTSLQFRVPPGPLHVVLDLPRNDAESLRGVVDAVLVVRDTSVVPSLQLVKVPLEDDLAYSAHWATLKRNSLYHLGSLYF